MWILSDGTQIEVEDRSNVFNIFKKMNARSDLWDLVDLLDGKDLSSFTLDEGALTGIYSGMVFLGITILGEDLEDMMMRINFTEEILHANSRLNGENSRLRDMLETANDKVEGYDILTGGM